MAKYEATPVGQGFGSQSRINENFENIEDNFQRVLYRDGSSPNQMLADLDMNSQRIINLPSATSASEPATYAQLLSAQIGGALPFVATFKEIQTATAGQQVITLTLVPYIPGSNNLSLYINGVRMAGDAYTEAGPNTITLSEALEAGDKIEAVINERTVESAFSFTGIAKEIFTATAGQTVFNITGVVYNPGSGNLSVYVDGVRQAGTAYSEDTPSSFSFLSPLAGGETVEIIVNERPVSADTVPASSVTATIDGVNTNVLDNLKKSQPIANVAALKALTGIVDGATRQTLGYYTAGDGGHGLYRFDAASSDTPNDGTVIQPDSGGGRWKLIHNGRISVKQFGAVADGAASNSGAEIEAALNTGLVVDFGDESNIYGTSQVIRPSQPFTFCGAGATIRAIGPLTGTPHSSTIDGVTNDSWPVLCVDSVKCFGEGVVLDANRPARGGQAGGGLVVSQGDGSEFKSVYGIRGEDGGDGSLGPANILVDNTNYCVFTLCGIDDADVEGFLSRNSTDVYVIGGEYKNSGSSCVASQFGSNVVVAMVRAMDAENSVVSINSEDSIVYSCNISGSANFFGINFGHRSSFATRKSAARSKAIGNTVYDCYAAGIHIGYGADVSVIGNTVYNCRGAYDATDTANYFGGISSRFWNEKVVIANNIVFNCTRGIDLDQDATDADESMTGRSNITGNTCYSNALSGIAVRPGPAVIKISDNICYLNNIESSASRAEIDISNSFTGAEGVIVEENYLGDFSADTINGIIVQGTGTWATPPQIKNNNLRRTTTPFAFSGSSNAQNNIVLSGNMLNGKRYSPRFTISTATTDINIGTQTYVRLSFGSSATVTDVTHQHDVGTILVIESTNSNATISDSTDFQLSSSFAMTADDTLTLIWTGGAWREIARSVN